MSIFGFFASVPHIAGDSLFLQPFGGNYDVFTLSPEPQARSTSRSVYGPLNPDVFCLRITYMYSSDSAPAGTTLFKGLSCREMQMHIYSMCVWGRRYTRGARYLHKTRTCTVSTETLSGDKVFTWRPTTYYSNLRGMSPRAAEGTAAVGCRARRHQRSHRPRL